MRNFECYIPTKVYFGKGQITHIEEVKKYCSKILLVYGGGSIKKNGIYDSTVEILKSSGIDIVELSGVQANPRIELIREGVDICRNNSIDGVLAIGSGSVTDSAKMIAAGACYDGDPWELVKNSSRIEDALPIFVVLTMAATGSEMDSFAVISDMTTNEKVGVTNPKLFPTFSILDPEYSYTVPERQLVAGTADIISHLLESYFNIDDDFDVTKGMCESVLKTVIKSLPIVLKDGNNYAARANLMWASSLAINGLFKCSAELVWPCHKLEHELSAFFDVVHGEGLAVVTPFWMDYILNDKTVDRFYEYGIRVWELQDEGSRMDVAKKAIAKTRAYFNNAGLPQTLSELGVKEDKLDIMAEKASALTNCGWVPLTKEDVLNIFKAAL